MQLTQSIKGILKNPYTTFLTLLLFLTPLVMSNNTNELFEFPKMFFVYFMGTGIIAIFLTDLVLKKQRVILPNKFILLFLLANFVSTAFSSQPYTSFWGYYTRFNDGLLSLLLYVGIYIVCVNKIKLSGFFNLMKVVALTIFPISLIGILQHFGWATPVIERVYSTFGQPNWLAQFLIMVLPFILYLFIAEASMFMFWGGLFVLGFSCLWFTYSMSGIAGFLAVIITFFIVALRKKLFIKSIIVRLAVLLFVCVLVVLTNLGLFKDKFADALKDAGKIVRVERVYAADQEYKVSDPGFIRFGLWGGSLKLFVSSPKVFFIGTGPETFPYEFQSFRPLSLNYSSEWDFVFNKPHNYYLELLTETGLAGFVIYILLLVKVAKRLPFYLLPGLVGFMVSNIFGWPVVSTALLFWFWAAWSGAEEI